MDNPSSSAGQRDRAVTVRRILKVNHAGEFGAIRIYGAQIWMARRLFPDIVPALCDMRDDEIEHCRLFRDAMPSRNARPCRVMAFWSLGGYLLGFLTALGGRNMVWICTEAVESTVHRHLEDQLAFLETRDPQLHGLIDSIQEEELAHLREAEKNQTRRGVGHALLLPVVAALTDLMIWLSTWGDSSWMRAEMARSRQI
ncbi:demethoxyubiquinone hydroxylase family protein [Rhizobium sp. L43]|uniref:demethoxyubiquinone hydroxylase family protein n=1 Tax=Rhizobium sp. L43 TaxID=2035452 RepID=UPI000BE87813|nr:demethoxyubiquinone hydroxylase family protein [Rhizobium sp. L43]PDS77413.1 demethoxyubiquinone hydroxylase family protein [Rhizobium sp. L43]